MLNRLRNIGPGALTAAAFIGPGTVTTATVAGAAYGYSLAWALLFATVAAIILQEMAVRLGVVGRAGLGEAILNAVSRRQALKWASIALIIAALFVGNAAYEGGNIAGAVLGLQAIAPAASRPTLALAIAVIAALLLIFGGYRLIERVLIAAVLIMTLAFGTALVVVGPDWGELIKGLTLPLVPEAAALPIAVGLIGTTIVPYNLFLHAAAGKKRWADASALPDARFDARLSIGLGGVVSILVLATAAASLFGSDGTVANAADMARQLEPAFGEAAVWLIGAGLFAAGLSSAITAPLATGFAAAELFGFDNDPKAMKFRFTAGSVLLIGAIVATTGAKPVQIILFAQFANGLLLPVIAVFLLIAANQKKLLGAHANGALANVAAGSVVLITAGLGLRALLRAAGILP